MKQFVKVSKRLSEKRSQFDHDTFTVTVEKRKTLIFYSNYGNLLEKFAWIFLLNFNSPKISIFKSRLP
jgi:hypothetical protein